MIIVKLDKASLLKGLVQNNYFPAQKKEEGEMPPLINSVTFTPEVAEKIKNLHSRKGGYDQVEYRSTRFNNVSRALSIPHPVPYAKLCYAIYDNWQEFEYITKSDNSLITPEVHSDGRILVMDYENSQEKIERHVELTFSKKFYVDTDISNFFPSVYSHSIPWALIGFDNAKKQRDPQLWFNQVDKCQMAMKRNETNGVPIGPATSNILSETILVRIDNTLKGEGFSFIRFIDDYTAYFDTYEQAEKFIRRLGEELSKYKLLLNAKKTVIEQLPCPSSPEWVVDLTTRIPNKEIIVPTNLIRFLDYAVDKQAVSPDGSVLKYAAKTIINDVDEKTVDLILKYLLGLCIKYPILIPLLNKLFDKIDQTGGFVYTQQLIKILEEHTINRRSDAMAWTLYYINKFAQPIPNETAKNIIESGDCISILLLYLSTQYDKEVIAFCDRLDKTDIFLIDQYWLLLYQLFLDNKITNPYMDENAYTDQLESGKDTLKNAMQREILAFETLKANGVNFVHIPRVESKPTPADTGSAAQLAAPF
jgi:hypothetical protein